MANINMANPLHLKCRRSVSLINLSSSENISDMGNLSNSEDKKLIKEIIHANFEPLKKYQYALARHVYTKFILNAWRHCRHKNKKTKDDLKQAETCMDNLNIQIAVLHNLLESEKNRVAKSMNEAFEYRVALEDETRQKIRFKHERDENQAKITSLKENIQDAKIEYLNVRNELLTCKSEQSALEEQMDREREKLGKFKEDKKILLEKLKISEEDNTTKQVQLNKQENEIQELKQLLLMEREANATSNTLVSESLSKLNALEENKSYLTKEVRILKGTNSQLVERIKNLEVLVNKKDKENIALTRTCHEQMLEMSHLQTSMTQLNNKNWMTQLPQLASFLVHIPIRILLHTLNFPLSNAQNF